MNGLRLSAEDNEPAQQEQRWEGAAANSICSDRGNGVITDKPVADLGRPDTGNQRSG